MKKIFTFMVLSLMAMTSAIAAESIINNFFIISNEFELQVNKYEALDNDLYRYDVHH